MILAWKDYEQMAKYRRPLAVILAVIAILCSTLAFVDAFDVAHVPGAGIFGAASWLLLAATLLVTSLGLRTNQSHES